MWDGVNFFWMTYFFIIVEVISLQPTANRLVSHIVRSPTQRRDESPPMDGGFVAAQFIAPL